MNKQELDEEEVEEKTQDEDKDETKEEESDDKDDSEEEKSEDESEEEAETDSEVKGKVTPKEEDSSEDEDEFVTLPDGTKVTHQELLSGYMKDADYRKKTAELARQREQVQPKDGTQQRDEKPNPVLSKYDKTQIEEFKILAKELGFVAKDDLSQMEAAKTKQEIVNSFYAQHPEYTKENDPTDARYNALNEELSIYNLNDTKTLAKILNKAHEAVEVKFSGSKEKAKALAQKERVKAATVGSRSGGGKSAGSEANEEYTPAQIEMMKKMGVYD